MDWIRVKICCIASQEEAELAKSLGADALGLVSEMPSGPGVISDFAISRIARFVDSPTETFLLTSKTNPKEIALQFAACGVTTLQLVDWLGIDAIRELRMFCPAARLVQVVHVEGENDISTALSVQSHVDALLLDSGRPGASVPELGGTGRTHDWAVSKTICEEASIPVYLAGGLNPKNVAEAVQTVQPFGVDLCSGVRSEDRLDPVKLRAFFEALKLFRINRPEVE